MIRAITKIEEVADEQYLVDYIEFRYLNDVGEFLTDVVGKDVLISKEMLERDFSPMCINKQFDTFETVDICITDIDETDEEFNIKYTINDRTEHTFTCYSDRGIEHALVAMACLFNLSVDALVLPTYTYK